MLPTPKDSMTKYLFLGMLLNPNGVSFITPIGSFSSWKIVGLSCLKGKMSSQ
jgi:hypothetical protein